MGPVEVDKTNKRGRTRIRPFLRQRMDSQTRISEKTKESPGTTRSSCLYIENSKDYQTVNTLFQKSFLNYEPLWKA